MIRPRPIGPGDTLRMIGVSGCLHEDTPEGVRDAAEACRARFEALGFRVQMDPTCYKQYGYLSGDDLERARALTEAFASDDVDGIVCLRGGWGVNRMLPMVDFEKIRAHPKAFIGFSDITSLHLALHRHADLCTFHGPMGTGLDSSAADSLLHALAEHPDSPFQEEPFTVLRPGRCEGEIAGGNLTLLNAALGTPYDFDFRGRILMIEEVHEMVYRVDRCLCQLLLAGKLDGIAGLAFGSFSGCDNEYPSSGFGLLEILNHYAGFVSGPVIASLSFGHIRRNLTLPMGQRYCLDTYAGLFAPATSSERTVTLC